MSYQRHSTQTQIIYAAGSRANPQAAAAYNVYNFSSWTPEIVEALNGGGIMGSAYPSAPIRGGRWSEIAFDMEVRGQYSVDDPPPEGSILRACGCSENLVGSTPNKTFTYIIADPHFYADGGSLDPMDDITVNINNRQAILLNLVGTGMEVDFVAGKIPMYKFQLRGKAPAAGSASAAGYTETTQSVAAFPGKRGVPWAGAALSVTGHTATPSLVIKAVNFKAMPRVEARPDANSTSGYGIPIITGYDPRLNLRLEERLLTQSNPYTQFMAGTTLTVSWGYNTGGAVGSVLTCTFIGKLAESPKSIESDGVLIHDLVLCQDPASAAFTMAWS